jgi:peptidyl-prolyl cis-trans isomerase C
LSIGSNSPLFRVRQSVTPLLAVPGNLALQTGGYLGKCPPPIAGAYPVPKDRFMKLLSYFARPAQAGASLSALALLAVLGVSPALVRAQDDPVVARVNGTDVRQSDLAMAEEDLGSNVPQMTAEAKREYLITFVGDMLLVAQAADAKKMADSNEFKQKLAYTRTKLLMESYLQSEAKAAVTDAELRKVYDEAIGQIKAEPEVRARHILVETEDEAKALVADLKKGADFAELAKTKSKDPGSADGGDLGYFTKDQMVPEFSEVAFKLEKGQLSDPVKSQFGWHVIKVEDKRDRQPPEFDKVKDQLESFVVRRQQSQLITKLRAEGKIERVGGPAPAPAPPPAEQKK